MSWLWGHMERPKKTALRGSIMPAPLHAPSLSDVHASQRHVNSSKLERHFHGLWDTQLCAPITSGHQHLSTELQGHSQT